MVFVLASCKVRSFKAEKALKAYLETEPGLSDLADCSWVQKGTQ